MPGVAPFACVAAHFALLLLTARGKAACRQAFNRC